ncbi:MULTISPECIES: hydrogen peroxide-inducible genes activator [unclassified Roseovarius]|uniref:hydrogen peroxide-inducible genes activator n=1 Tax=unclassified Roseovarius TaxID=2614913 RepID=UPI00273E7E50|nr:MULTISPECIES: hydrogen peroxide-inducible genes activator [unclassified Roseovarius]
MADEITLRQLRYFVALAETRHYRRAAERMGVSQPSLSQQIVNLEAALGLEVVERGRRGAVLSPAGRDVLTHARRVLDEVSALAALPPALRDGAGGTIRLGSTPTLGPYILPYVVRRLRRSFPDLKVIIRDAAPAVLRDELMEGLHDIILTQLPVISGDVEVQRLFREPLKLVVAQDHPLAGQAAVSDAELAGQDILALSSTYVLHDQIRELSAELGATLRQDYEGTSLDALRQMTALNMGVCFLPALYVLSEIPAQYDDVAVLRFRQDRFTRSVGLVWRRQSAHGAVIERVTGVVRGVARDRFAGHVTVE